METKTFKIEKAGSSIEWIGKKVTGAHNGTIDVTGGVITLITHSIEFEATIDSIQGNTLKASATVIVDRTKYEMKFRSGNFFKDLGDTLIYNDFVLNVHLTAKAA